MKYFLAIDAGGTRTRCVLADATRELARAEAGSIKRLRVSAEEAEHNLNAALVTLFAGTGLSLQAVASTCAGISGASVPLVKDWIVERLQSLVSGKVQVCGDDEIALDAAFHGGSGALVVAGTGSMAVGRSRDGHLVNAGGWGPALSDEGSGHWIGQQALRAAFRAVDAGRPCTLLAAIEEHWQLTGTAQLIEKANANPPPDFAELTKLVTASAAAGDAVSIKVLVQAGEELALLVQLLVGKLRDREGGSFVLPAVAMTGSVLARVAAVKRAMTAALRRTFPGIEIIEEPVDPVQGALWRAREALPRAP